MGCKTASCCVACVVLLLWHELGLSLLLWCQAGLVRMLSDLGLYSSIFSQQLLEETSAFYRSEGERLMETSDVPHYLLHCEVSCPSEAVLAGHAAG